MMFRSNFRILTALALIASAGSVAPCFAQDTSSMPADRTMTSKAMDFRTSSWLSDRDVVNNNAEEVGDVSDLILNRGSGRIEYVIIKTGSTMGMGGRGVLIPFSALSWETGSKDRFVLASTPEQIKKYPEYTSESWKAMRDVSTTNNSPLRDKLAADAGASTDPYSGNINSAASERVTGRITQVDRVRSSFGEQVHICVQPQSGQVRKVALGPSWFVNAAPAAPMRGETITVDTLALPRDPDQLLVGTHLRSGANELHLRDAKGTPAWSLKTVALGGSESEGVSVPYARYMLASALPGMKIDCRGADAGRVQDIILDRHSGEIGFVSIDPNQNFLGIGDTKRLVPWSVATVMLNGTMRIDASKEMVLASMETPSDLSTLNSEDQAGRVYKAFNVPAPRFAPPTSSRMANPGSDAAWSHTGPIIRGIERDSHAVIDGTFAGFSDVGFGSGTRPARAVKIKLAGDPGVEELVLLGPAWYMDNQKSSWASGDAIKVDAARTMIDGRRYWIARSVDCKNSRVVLLDKDNAPAWSQP